MLCVAHRLWFGSVAALLAAAAFAAIAGGAKAASVVPGATPGGSCSPKPYAYAGLVSSVPAAGIESVVTTVAAANVLSGHVAGWIGVGSPKAGPTGQPEWLQAGVNTQAGIGSQLYAEVTLPGHSPRYITLASGIEPGSSYHIAVVEIRSRPDVWHVLVDGKAATGAINLPGSSHFRPMAMGESWNGGAPHCNGFDYRFDQLNIMTGRSWQGLTASSVVSDVGFKVTNRTKAGFSALSA